MPDVLEGQKIQSPENVAAISISNEITSIVGNTAVTIVKPTGDQSKFIVLQSKSGNWNLRLGTIADGDMPAAYAEASALSGTAALGLKEGALIVVTAMQNLTVKGYDSGALVYYYI